MKIIELNEIQFRNYSRLHSNRNYLQSIEYANMQKAYGFNVLYVGMVDVDDKLIAASLILNKKAFSKFSYGISPGGFLIDYNNFDLLKNFSDLLKEFLFKKDYIYLQVEPRCIINTTNKKMKIFYSATSIINNIKNLEAIFVENNLNNKYAVYLEVNNEKDLYKNFTRSLKRTIQDCKDMGIAIYEGNVSNIDEFYALISKKTNREIEYYYNFAHSFNNSNNLFSIYFAKLEPEAYLKNATSILNKEQKRNEKLNKRMQSNNITNKLLNQKISSDKKIQKYNKKLKEAIKLFNIYPNGIIISTCAIIKTNNEITFLIDGYEEKLRNIRASVMLRYELIKKFNKQGYSRFNLGFLPKDKGNVNFKHIYDVRMNFGANFVEFPDAFHIVINKFLYNVPIISKTQSRIDS